MGPKKRKSKDLDEQIPDAPKPQKKPKKVAGGKIDAPKLASQSSKVKEGEKSKYFKNKTIDPCKPSSSGLHDNKSNVNQAVCAQTCQKSKDGKVKKSSAGKRITVDTNNKKLDPSSLSTSDPSIKEVVVDKRLDVDAVKKLIKDREDKKTRALKRIENLPPTDFHEDSNENSKNVLNLDVPKTKGTEELDFSKFPNVTKFIVGRQVNGSESKSAREIQNWCVSKKLQDFKLLDRNSFVEARITTISWNQHRPQQVAFSDKHGHIIVGDLKELENSMSWKLLLQKSGIGPGGNILAMKFAKSKKPDHYVLWSVGLEGKVVKFECPYYDEILALVPEDLNYKTFLPTNNYEHWYPGMDIDFHETLLAAGCTKGFVKFMTPEGELVETFKAHKGKILNVEFCRKNPMLLSTTSLDKSVRIWDRRYIKSITDHIADLTHNHGINSAYFNDRCDMLLTTDQKDEIRTYDTSTWRVLSSIYHPHRQFQHLTPIKATWHPSADIIVAGNYPMEKRDRCVDVMSAQGDSICKLESSSGLIQAVARFSPDGKYLLSSFGCGIEVWGTRNKPVSSKEAA